MGCFQGYLFFLEKLPDALIRNNFFYEELEIDQVASVQSESCVFSDGKINVLHREKSTKFKNFKKFEVYIFNVYLKSLQPNIKRALEPVSTFVMLVFSPL